MKLQYLAAYLPYNLMCKVDGYINPLPMISAYDEDQNEYGCGAALQEKSGNDFGFSPDEFKPILRPLSDLFKEIEIKGDKFIPVELLDSESYPVDYFDVEMNFYEYLENWVDSKEKSHHIQFIPFGFIQQLLEWHFDVFGLIEKGLAVDINSL
jgi:hypothetical protein